MIFLRRAAHVAVFTFVLIPITVVLTISQAVAEPRKRSQAVAESRKRSQAVAEPRKRSQAVAAAVARRRLAQLKVARPLSIRGYSRERFQSRLSANRKGRCSTREIVLARDGRDVRRNAACHPVKGLWYSPYDGKWLKNEKYVDVDHLVPLAYAWRSGAKRWSPAKRRAFANDLVRPELLTVSHSANIAKGGKGPQSWRPQRRAHWCRYATSWITVKRHYGLFVTRKERVALLNMLRTC